MSQANQKLRADARALPYADRVDLIDELIDSLHDDDPPIDPAWATELEDRARRALAHPSRGVSWADARTTIETKRR